MINLSYALIEKQPEWATKQGEIIFQHDNTPAHKAIPVHERLQAATPLGVFT